jgi:hypothetical protein
MTPEEYKTLIQEAPKNAREIDDAMKNAGLEGWSRLAYGKILFEHFLSNL